MGHNTVAFLKILIDEMNFIGARTGKASHLAIGPRLFPSKTFTEKKYIPCISQKIEVAIGICSQDIACHSVGNLTHENIWPSVHSDLATFREQGNRG